MTPSIKEAVAQYREFWINHCEMHEIDLPEDEDRGMMLHYEQNIIDHATTKDTP